MATPTAFPAVMARGPHPPQVTPFTVDVHVPTITPFHFTPVHRTDCVTATPDPNGFVPAGSCNALWEYYPSMAAAVAFAIIFGALLIAHISQSVIYKKKFCFVIIVATSWEFASYILRALAVHNQQSSILALMSQLLVLLAPLWINAYVYMVFARLVYFLLPSHRLYGIHASKISFVFVWLDFFSFLVQLIGGFDASPGAPNDQIQTGLHIYMGGIGIQEFWILIVLVLTVCLWVEVRKRERTGGLRPEQAKNWRKVIITVFATLSTLTIRVIFRLVEFSGGVGSNNPFIFKEVYFYLFDGTIMALSTLMLSVVHAGAFFQGPWSEFPSLSRAEKKDVKRIRKEAKAAAKDRGENFWSRWRLGREAKRQETERIMATKWGVTADSLQDEKMDEMYLNSD